MNTNDLRIGNLIQGSQITKVALLSEFEINGVPDNEFKGIPLTEEIVLKCGFKRFRENGYGNHVYKIPYIEFYLFVGHGVVGFIGRNGTFGFLHELQNFYYTWTGKELEVIL